MIAGNTGRLFFPFTVQQANFQVVCGDLHVETVFHTLIIEVLIRVQLVRFTVHFTRIRVDLLTHHVDQALCIQNPSRDLCSLQGGPDDFYLVLQLNDLCFRVFLPGDTAGDEYAVVTQRQR